MKIKTKLIASIMSICLVCAVFAIGVFALKTANLKIGGDVSFSATGVEADIKNVTLTGATNNDQVLATGSINTSMTQAEIDSKFQNWQTLELDFDENATDIVFSFEIANMATNPSNYIEIDYDYSFNKDNPNVNCIFETSTSSLFLSPKGEAESGTYTIVTITFRIEDDELNVSDGTKVDMTIVLKHQGAVGGEYNSSTKKLTGTDGIVYTLNTDGTASLESDGNMIGDNYGYAGDADLEIATLVSDGINHYIVTTIGDGAFFCQGSGNMVIRSVIIPDKVTSIGAFAFMRSSLTSIIIPDSVTSIGESAFRGTNMTSITLPKGLTSISESLFESGSLTSIIIPNGVTSIGQLAFDGCSFTEITIPSSVTRIDGSAFSGCAMPTAKFDNPNGWFKATSATATTGTTVTVTSDFTQDNANVLKNHSSGYLLRKDA